MAQDPSGTRAPVCRSPPEVPQAVKSEHAVNTVVTDVQAEVKKAVSKKPESLEEYLPVGRYYAAKKLLLALLIAAILLPILYFKFVHPAVTAVFYGKRSR